HETVQDERVVRTEEVGHPHLFRHAGLANPLEDVILRHLAAGRQRTTLRCDRLDLRPQRDLIVQKRVSGGAIFGTFVGVVEMFHSLLPDAVKPYETKTRRQDVSSWPTSSVHSEGGSARELSTRLTAPCRIARL